MHCLFVIKSGNSWQDFPFQQLQWGTSASGYKGNFILHIPLGGSSRRISTTDDTDITSSSSLSNSLKQRFSALGEVFKLEYTLEDARFIDLWRWREMIVTQVSV